MKTFTFTANEDEVKAIYLCMDAALRSAGEKALDAANLVKKVLNTGVVVEEPAPEPPAE
jgi:hypothetical protein